MTNISVTANRCDIKIARLTGAFMTYISVTANRCGNKILLEHSTSLTRAFYIYFANSKKLLLKLKAYHA